MENIIIVSFNVESEAYQALTEPVMILDIPLFDDAEAVRQQINGADSWLR